MNAEIYSKDNCTYCTMAKKLFEKENISYIEVNAVENREYLFERVTKETGFPPKTVPQIWIDDKYIGGFSHLQEWIKAPWER